MVNFYVCLWNEISLSSILNFNVVQFLYKYLIVNIHVQVRIVELGLIEYPSQQKSKNSEKSTIGYHIDLGTQG